MPQLLMSRRDFAGVPVALTTVPQPEPGQPRRVVALGWISRSGGQVTISERLIGSSNDPVGR